MPDELKKLGDLFQEEAKTFLEGFTGNLRYEIQGSIARQSICLSKAVATGEWEKYREDLKFEASVLASVAAIGSSEAQELVNKWVKQAFAKGAALLIAAI